MRGDLVADAGQTITSRHNHGRYRWSARYVHYQAIIVQGKLVLDEDP
jgi:hypothetical protein